MKATAEREAGQVRTHAEREAAEDKGYQFLVRTAAGELVGRVNLSGGLSFDVTRSRTGSTRGPQAPGFG